MKRIVCIILMSIFLCACAAAETGEKLTAEYFVQAANAEYPEWTVWNSERFARGTVNSGFEEHIILSLYRISNGYIEALELRAVTNTLQEGDEIPWEKTLLVPVEIAAGQEGTLMRMKPNQIFDDGGSGAYFSKEAGTMLAANLLDEGERMVQLMAYSDALVAVTENGAGQVILKIADSNGKTLSTPPQDYLWVNPIHSWNKSIEFYAGDEIEGVINTLKDAIPMKRFGEAEEVAKLALFLASEHSDYITGEVIRIEKDCLIDVSSMNDGGWQNNDGFHYGVPMFETELERLDLTHMPTELRDMVADLDTTRTVCTAHEDTPIYAQPEGEQIALCYARAPGTVLAQKNGWTKIQLGRAKQGMTAWARDEDLAFGAETEGIRCTFPSFDSFYRDEDEPKFAEKMDGSIIQLDCSEHTPWLIGKRADGRWLVMLYGGGEEGNAVCVAEECVFDPVRPTERDEWEDEPIAPKDGAVAFEIP